MRFWWIYEGLLMSGLPFLWIYEGLLMSEIIFHKMKNFHEMRRGAVFHLISGRPIIWDGSRVKKKSEKKSVRNHVFRAFFEVFEARGYSRNDREQVWENRFSEIFVDFRRNFRGVVRFFAKSHDFFMKSHDFSWKVMIFHEKSWFFTKSRHLLESRGNKTPCTLMGKRLQSRRAGIYPPAFFSPGPADPIPPYDGGGPRRGDNNNNNNNTMASCKGPVPSSRPGNFD